MLNIINYNDNVEWFFSHNGVPIAPFKTIQTILKNLT